MTLFGMPWYQGWLLVGLAVFFVDAVRSIYRECDGEALTAASHPGSRIPGRKEAVIGAMGVVALIVGAGPLGIIGLLNPNRWGSATPLFPCKDDGSSELFPMLKTLVVLRNADDQYLREDGTLSFRVRSARVMLLAEALRDYPDFKAVSLSSVLSIHPDYL